MSRIDEHTLAGLHDELRKYALDLRNVTRLGSALGTAGAGAGAGAFLGGVGTGAMRGVQGYRQAREEGATVGQALGHGAMQGGQGAMRGAAIGAAVGGVGGAATGAISPAMGNKLRTALNRVPGSHYGQRQVHSLTGWRPDEGIGSIGLGTATRKGMVEGAQKRLADLREGNDTRGFITKGIDKLRGRSALQSAERNLTQAQQGLNAAQRAEDMGLTNIPGYFKSLKTHGIGKTLGAAAGESWHGTGMGMKALTVGIPLASAGHTLLTGTQEGGESKGKRLGMDLAGAATGAFLSPLSLTTQMAMGAPMINLGGSIGNVAGKAFERSRPRVAPPQPQVMSPEQAYNG